MASALYNSFKLKGYNGSNINLVSDTIKVALCTSSYTPNIDSHTVFSDITNEVSGTGYSAGGATLGSQAWVQDNTNDLAWLDAADTSWSSSTITARYAIIYKSTGTASTSPLIGYIDFGGDKTTSSDTFYIQWDTAGILKLT